jgi:hypothetical protein
MIKREDETGGRKMGSLGSSPLYLLSRLLKCPCCVIEYADVGSCPRNAADLPRMEMSPLRNEGHRDSGGASWAVCWAVCWAIYITAHTHICGIAMNSQSVNMPARVYM